MHTLAKIQPELLSPLLPPLSIIDRGGRYLFHSNKAKTTLGFWNTKSLPKHINDIAYPELLGRLRELLETSSGETPPIEFKLKAPLPDAHVLSFKFEPHPDQKDLFIVSYPTDPVAYMPENQAENSLLDSISSKFSLPETIFYNNALGLSLSDMDGKILKVNRSFAKMVGYEAEELAGRSFYELTHPEDAPPNKDLIKKLISGKNDWISFEKRYIKKDGNSLWCRLWVRVLEEYKESYLLATIQNISEEKHVNEQLSIKRRQLESLYQNAFVGISLIDIDGNVLKVNPAFEKIIGYTEAELQKLSFRALTHPDDREYNHHLRKKVISQESGSYTMVKRYIRKDGSIIWVNLSVSGLLNEQNEIKELIGTVVDISEEKIAIERLQESEKRYRLIANNSLDLISLFRIEEEAIISFLSPSVTHLLGYSAVELENTPWKQLVHPEDRGFLTEILNLDIQDKSEIRYRVIPKEGEFIWIESVFAPVRDQNGVLIYIQGNSRDITDRISAEIELDMKVAELDDANSKLKQYISSNSELEKFAYIASHDLREPLRTIIGFTQILASRYREELNPEANEFLDLILDASRHMHQLVQDLLQYSRVSNESMDYKEINPRRLMIRLKTDLDEVLQEKDGVLIVLAMPEEIYGHETGIYRVFLNLISNSLKFKRPGISPEVVVSGKEIEEGWQFSISDNGIGIDSSYHEQVFLLFKRLHSKVDFEGSGLGLPICRKIVDRHHGNIWVDSKKGVGSTFHFTIARKLKVAYRLP